MTRKKWGKRNRIDLYADDDELIMIELLANDNGMSMSAYVRAMVRREWNASPHLQDKLASIKRGIEQVKE